MRKLKIVLVLFILPLIAFSQWTDQSNWSHVGPKKDNSGGKYETGRLDAIVLHPNYGIGNNRTIFAGGNNGGLWYTTDDGENWFNISTNYMRYSGVADIAITSDGNYLYVGDRTHKGSGGMDRAGGVYKYNILTGQWVSSSNFFPYTGYLSKNNHLKIHPTDNSTVFACTNMGIYRTTNGATFSAVWGPTSTEIENIAFVPNANSTGGYDIYASGYNKFLISTNKGASFTDVTSLSPNNPFTAYTNPHFDIAYGGIDNDGTSQIIYLYGYVDSPSKKNVLYKYRIPTSGSPTMTFITEVPSILIPSQLTPDRLCVYGDKNSVYMGTEGLFKYNFFNNTMYDPVPNINGGNDMALPLGGAPSYFLPCCTKYKTMIHPDLHDIKIFDNGTIRKIFVVHDGGLSVNSYSLTATTGVFANTWEYKNVGLNIATLHGFSGSELKTDVYATGEQDTKGFMFIQDMSKCVSFGVEPAMVLIDKVNESRLFRNFQLNKNNPYVDQVVFHDPPASDSYSSATTKLCDPVQGVNYFMPNAQTPSEPTTAPAERGMFYQDPVRPENIYAMAGGLWKFDETTQLFGLKYRTGKYYSDANVLKRDHWTVSAINSMAVSRTNKNKIYMAGNNYYVPGDETVASHIYRYTGSNIDDSWGGIGSNPGHNDGNWDLIDPNLNGAPFNHSLSTSEIQLVRYSYLVMSDWDENKLWVMANDGRHGRALNNYPGIKILKYDNGSWSNYSTGLGLDEYPQAMVYERGSNDGIYMATECSIYYRNASMSYWELYDNGNKVPNIFIPQLEINYKENTLRAGTFGRGIWKTNIVCPTAPLTKNNCTNCNSSTNYFWEGTNVTVSNTTLTTHKQMIRAVDYIDILPNTTLNPSGNTSVYFEVFIHGCGPSQGNSFKSYSMIDNENIVNDEKETSNMEIFPNPNDGLFTLNIVSENFKSIYVYDLLGKLVYQKTGSKEQRFDIDITEQPKGVYIVKVFDGDIVKMFKVINQ